MASVGVDPHLSPTTSAQARRALRSVIAFYVHHTFGAVTVTVTVTRIFYFILFESIFVRARCMYHSTPRSYFCVSFCALCLIPSLPVTLITTTTQQHKSDFPQCYQGLHPPHPSDGTRTRTEFHQFQSRRPWYRSSTPTVGLWIRLIFANRSAKAGPVD
jgi:hypothetical protein